MDVRSKRERLSTAAASYSARAQDASEKHASVAVPFRTMDKNQRLAASALSGGFAYRLFFWILPFGLVVGGALGLLNFDTNEDAFKAGGLPAAIVNDIGDVARASGSASWWLFLVGVPLLLWAGYTGSKAVILIHSLVWNDPPQRGANPLRLSLAFTVVALLLTATVGVTAWISDQSRLGGVLAAVITALLVAGVWLWVSLRLPHGDVGWKELIPGALLFGIGIALLHVVTRYFLQSKIEKASELYGSLGAVTTTLFWFYLVGRLIVTSPILNSSIHEERLHRREGESPG